MSASTLKKLNARAKQIRAKKPGMKYATAQKQAGAEFRAGKLGGVKKRRATRKKTVRKKVGSVKRKPAKRKKKVGSVRKRSIGSVASHTSAARRLLEEQLAWNLLNISQAKTKMAKRKLQKRSTILKRKLKGLSA